MILIFVIGALFAIAPWVWRRIQAERHRRRLAAQLRQSLQSMVHALRIGVGFMQAMDYVAKECEEPLGAHWRSLQQTVQVGKPLNQALDDLQARVPLKEMRWFVAAVQITQTTGGSLADVLDTLSNTLREQQLLREKISALTAQGKVSGILLGSLPFLILAALYVIAPEMVTPLFTNVYGQAMLAVVILMVTAGGFVIKSIVTIQVD